MTETNGTLNTLRNLVIGLVLGSYIFTAAAIVWLWAQTDTRLTRIENEHRSGAATFRALDDRLRVLEHKR